LGGGGRPRISAGKKDNTWKSPKERKRLQKGTLCARKERPARCTAKEMIVAIQGEPRKKASRGRMSRFSKVAEKRRWSEGRHEGFTSDRACVVGKGTSLAARAGNRLMAGGRDRNQSKTGGKGYSRGGRLLFGGGLYSWRGSKMQVARQSKRRHLRSRANKAMTKYTHREKGSYSETGPSGREM